MRDEEVILLIKVVCVLGVSAAIGLTVVEATKVVMHPQSLCVTQETK